jgi:hypothetical protein
MVVSGFSLLGTVSFLGFTTVYFVDQPIMFLPKAARMGVP